MIRRAFPGAVTSIGPREFKFTAVPAKRGRDGHVLVPAGVDLTDYKRNPVILYQHLPEKPVARCTGIALVDGEIRGSALFPEAGLSPSVDEICNLVKSGVLSAMSIGFEILQAEPLNAKQGKAGGLRITSAQALEFSIVSLPSDTGAMITARTAPGAHVMLQTHRRSLADRLDEMRGHVWDAQNHHGDLASALRQGNNSDAMRSHRELGHCLDRCERSLCTLGKESAALDIENTSKSQTTAGVTYGTSSDGRSFHQRQLALRALAPRLPVADGGPAGVAAIASLNFSAPSSTSRPARAPVRSVARYLALSGNKQPRHCAASNSERRGAAGEPHTSSARSSRRVTATTPAAGRVVAVSSGAIGTNAERIDRKIKGHPWPIV